MGRKHRRPRVDEQALRVEKIVAAVRNSPKYRTVCEDVIRRIAHDELPKWRSPRLALKAVKNRLHQVGGAYLRGPMAYDLWLGALRELGTPPPEDELRKACRLIMRAHASTRERLPILEEFYARTLGPIAPVHSVLDLACGLNPLAIPWMPLASDARYYAYDIYEDMTAFVAGFLALLGVEGEAAARDLTQITPPQPVDVALILKTIPCLEQIDKSLGLRLLEQVNARHVLVSFPVRSLGGRAKGMTQHYTQHLEALLAEKDWPVQRFEFATELAFLVSKPEAGV